MVTKMAGNSLDRLHDKAMDWLGGRLIGFGGAKGKIG